MPDKSELERANDFFANCRFGLCAVGLWILNTTWIFLCTPATDTLDLDARIAMSAMLAMIATIFSGILLMWLIEFVGALTKHSKVVREHKRQLRNSKMAEEIATEIVNDAK